MNDKHMEVTLSIPIEFYRDGYIFEKNSFINAYKNVNNMPIVIECDNDNSCVVGYAKEAICLNGFVFIDCIIFQKDIDLNKGLTIRCKNCDFRNNIITSIEIAEFIAFKN